MSPLLIGISAAVSLLFLASLALAMMQKVRNARDDGPWPMRDGARVLATITDFQIKQDWKEGERWERSLWDGRLTRQNTWQTYYNVTAEWRYPQTKQSYLFREPGLGRRRSKGTHTGTDGCLHRRPSSSWALCCGHAVPLLSEAYTEHQVHECRWEACQLQGKDRERWSTSSRTLDFLPLFSVRNVSARRPTTVQWGKLIKVKNDVDHATLRYMAASLLLAQEQDSKKGAFDEQRRNGTIA